MGRRCCIIYCKGIYDDKKKTKSISNSIYKKEMQRELSLDKELGKLYPRFKI